MIWKYKPSLDLLNKMGDNALPGHLGIVFTEVGDDYLEATMPVDERTVQPMRLLHGGASVVLAETVGSVAGAYCVVDRNKEAVVGLEINANHLNSVKEGDMVIARVEPIKVGRSVHVWEIKIRRGDGKLACVSRLTLAVVARR